MRTLGIVLLAPGLYQDLHLFEGREDCHREKLISKPAVETLSKTVLPRTARRNEMTLELPPRQPSLDDVRDELGAIVAFEILRCAERFDQSV